MSDKPHITIDTTEVHKGIPSVFNMDGWQNVMTGMGLKNLDRRENSEFYMNSILAMETLSDMYRSEGIAKKIVDIPAKDMLRAGFTVEGDTDHAIPKALRKLKLHRSLRKAVTWSRCFGGSLVLMGVNDGPKKLNVKVLETEVNEDRIEEISFFRVYDRRQVVWYAEDIETDPTKDNYGKPNFYTIFPLTSGATIFPMFKVHHSRIIQFSGVQLPERETQQQYGFGDSVLQSVFTRLRGFAGAMNATEDILNEFIIGVMTINNLQDLIAGGREKDLIARLNQVDMSKSIMNTMLVDKEEEYTRLSATVNGIKDILEFEKDTLSAVSGIPQVKLFGEQAQGLGSEAAGNIRLYYDDIADMQEEVITEPLERICTLLVKSKKFKKENPGVDIKDIVIQYPSLWQMSAKDEAEAHFTQAKADDLYIGNGTLDRNEVAKARFGNKSYSYATVLDESLDRNKIKPLKLAKDPKPSEKDSKDVSNAAD